MAKTPRRSSSDKLIAYGLLRKAMSETGLGRDSLPQKIWASLTRLFNSETKNALSTDEFRKTATNVDKRGTDKVEKRLRRVGLAVPPKKSPKV